jgi:hypothetical protein
VLENAQALVYDNLNKARLPICKGVIGSHHSVEVLSDSGCTTVGVRKKFVDTNQYTGEFCHCVTLCGWIEKFPVAVIDIDTPYYSGSVRVCVLDNPAHDLILGNIPQLKTFNVRNLEMACPVLTRDQAKRQNQSQTTKLIQTQLPEIGIDSQRMCTLRKDDPTLAVLFDRVETRSPKICIPVWLLIYLRRGFCTGVLLAMTTRSRKIKY